MTDDELQQIADALGDAFVQAMSRYFTNGGGDLLRSLIAEEVDPIRRAMVGMPASDDPIDEALSDATPGLIDVTRGNAAGLQELDGKLLALQQALAAAEVARTEDRTKARLDAEHRHKVMLATIGGLFGIVGPIMLVVVNAWLT